MRSLIKLISALASPFLLAGLLSCNDREGTETKYPAGLGHKLSVGYVILPFPDNTHARLEGLTGDSPSLYRGDKWGTELVRVQYNSEGRLPLIYRPGKPTFMTTQRDSAVFRNIANQILTNLKLGEDIGAESSALYLKFVEVEKMP